MPELIEFYWDRHRIYRGAILLLMLGSPGVLLTTMEGIDATCLGLAWVAGFLTLAAVVYSRSFDSLPVITISTDGLHDRRISTKPIPWVRITCIEEFDAENVSFVGLGIDDPKAALADAKLLVRLIAPLHRLLGFPTVTINTSLLNTDDHTLIAAIERFQPALLQQ